MNKFRDPMTGDVFKNIKDAYAEFCDKKSAKECNDCPIAIKTNQKHLFCFEYVYKFPTEAARLMGYEVIEGSSTEIDETPSDRPTTLDDTPTGSGDGPTEELVKQKPRLAEVLGVTEDATWRHSELSGLYRIHNGVREYWDANYGWLDCNCEEDLIKIINNPGAIAYLQRFTAPETDLIKAMKATWVSRDKTGTDTEWVDFWVVTPILRDGEYIGSGHRGKVEAAMMPFVKKGDCLKFEEVGGNG